MKFIRTIISTLFFLFLFLYCHPQAGSSIAAAEFEKAISNIDSVQLLDVRTPAEYNTGHLPHALLADWKDEKEFDRRIGYIDKEKPVYVYCLGGGRSAAAAAKMRAMGYRNVYELKGGVNSWKAANKSLEGKNPGEKQMSINEFTTAIKASKTVLVDFGAEWCPPCKKMEPVLKSLQNNYPGKFTLVKVDGGKDEIILKEYNITTLPVFIIYKDGKQVWRREGFAEEKELAALLN